MTSTLQEAKPYQHNPQDHGTRGNSVHSMSPEKDYNRIMRDAHTMSEGEAITEGIHDWLDEQKPHVPTLQERRDLGQHILSTKDWEHMYSSGRFHANEADHPLEQPLDPTSKAYKMARKTLAEILNQNGIQSEDRATAEGLFETNPKIQRELYAIYQDRHAEKRSI